MKAYILSIVGVILLTAVITIIAPHGKMEKFLKGTAKLVVLSALIAPIAGFLTEKAPSLSTAEIGTDTAYLEYCAECYADADERAIKKFLEEEYSVAAEVVVTRNADATFSYEKITVRMENEGISGQDGNINISEEIESVLEARYGCNTEVI